VNKPDFQRWFNRGFWKAPSRSDPLKFRKTGSESHIGQVGLRRHRSGIQESELLINKGYDVAVNSLIPSI
jgi:hypothetical protein